MKLVTNKNGIMVLKNFEMANTSHSPSYDDRESEVAQKELWEHNLDVAFCLTQKDLFGHILMNGNNSSVVTSIDR